MDAALADLLQVFRAAQHAGRRAADLDMRLAADRRQLEHRVEGRDLVDADVGHIEHAATYSIAGRDTQPSFCSCARHSSGITAEACLPSGYFVIVSLAQARFAGVKAKLSG